MYYDKPNESQIHKEGKNVMKLILETKKQITFNRYCGGCKAMKKQHVINLNNKDYQIFQEYSFRFNGSARSADVALIEDGNLIYIFEICHTHKTLEENRPEPFFEIIAKNLIESVDSMIDKDIVEIKCIRDFQCHHCIEKRKIFEEQILEDMEKERLQEEEKQRKKQELIEKERLQEEEKRRTMEMERLKHIAWVNDCRIRQERTKKEDAERYERERPERERKQREQKQREEESRERDMEIREKNKREQEKKAREMKEREHYLNRKEDEYLKSLSKLELQAYDIAKSSLGDFFSVRNSNGFVKFCAL
jgi:type IV secretory pathway VirB10-like protein